MDQNQHIRWLIDSAKSTYDSNIYKAKAWLLTGTTLYPDSISLKMEYYKLAKKEKSVQEAAQHFSQILCLSGAGSHAELQEEIKILLASVQNDNITPEHRLNADIFSAIPEEQQCNILKEISSKSPDVLSRCSMLLLLVKRFPWQAKEFGTSLIETLFEAEINESPKNVVNIYRKYFVTDALPMMLKENPAGTDRKILLNWLDKALQYYIVTSFQSNKEGMRSPPTTPSATMKKPSFITRPWENMAELLNLVARQVKWNVTPNLFADNNLLLQYLISLKQRLSKEHSKTMKKEFIYNSTYLLLKHINQYTSFIKRSSDTVCLIRQCFSNSKTTYSKKHRQVQESSTTISAAEGLPQGENIVSSFKSACDIWQLIHSDSSLVKAYDDLLDKLDFPIWSHCLSHFDRDRKLYVGNYQECIQYDDKEVVYQMQKVSSFYALGQKKEAAVLLIETLPQIHISKGQHKQLPLQEDSKPSTTFLFVTDSDQLFDSGAKLLTQMLKDAVMVDPSNDDTIGHLCVLLQLEWHSQKEEFERVVGIIRSAQKFTYPCFFEYIINVDMLEEFAYLKSEQGGGVTLEIQPASKLSKQRTVTRGVAKDVKEDFKALFERQVSRTTDCKRTLIQKFVSDKKNELLVLF